MTITQELFLERELSPFCEESKSININFLSLKDILSKCPMF